MVFVVRKEKLYLIAYNGKRHAWTAEAEMATAFASYGEAAVRAEKLGFDARDIAVEPVEV